MKSLISAGSLAIGIILLVHLSSFQSGAEQPASTTIQAITTQFHHQLEAFQEATANYHATGKAFAEGTTTQEALQEAHLNTRLAFKRASYLLEYNDRYSIKKDINGAPLPSVEPKVPEVAVIEPTGLQVLDEIVFADEVAQEDVPDEFLRLLEEADRARPSSTSDKS